MRTLIALALAALAVGGCTRRDVVDTHALAAYRYCLIPPAEAHGHMGIARHYLGQVFEIVKDKDPRLADTDFQKQTCIASVDHWRGLWRTRARVDIRNYGVDAEDAEFKENVVLRVTAIHGMCWGGAEGAARQALEEAAKARAWAEAYPDARSP